MSSIGRWDRSLYTGTELTGKTLGVIGLGKSRVKIVHIHFFLRYANW
jgi:phosphoglycerate dehydrogenase-like enzyme